MECNDGIRKRQWMQQPWFKVMSLNNQAAVGSIKSQQRICGPFQLKALRKFTPTLFLAGPTDKKNKTKHILYLCGHWRRHLRDSQSLNVYNGLDVLHFKTLKHASSCVRKQRRRVQKKYYSIEESCSWHRGEEVVIPAAFARFLGKQLDACGIRSE